MPIREFSKPTFRENCRTDDRSRALVEAAWTYRYPARVSEALRLRLEGLPKAVRDIAWKAQIRLCTRYRRLNAAGKKPPVIVAAIAREMAAFLWAIGREVAPS
jgi:transposase